MLRPLLFAVLIATSSAATEAPPSAAAPAPATPEPVNPERYWIISPERLALLPEPERRTWTAYLDQSRCRAADARAVLQAELDSLHLPLALQAPSGGDFKAEREDSDPWFTTPEAGALATTLLSWQAPFGGWSKHLGYSRGPRVPGTQWTSQNDPAQPWHYLATFDNNATTGEINFLAQCWLATRRDDCRHAVHHGLDFIFAAQFPTGGWPQVYPIEGKYHDNITINDDALVNILELLNDVATSAPRYACVDAPRREKARAAVATCLRFLLAAQVRQNGLPTGWCAQHDPLTLAPASARLKEPAALGAPETANLLKFLMRDAAPTPELRASIEGALAWLEKVKIPHLRETRNAAGKKTYITDPASGSDYWARFYDLKTNQALFAGAQDGIVYTSYDEMVAKNKVSYDFYTTRPLSVVTTGAKKWRKALAKAAKPAKGGK